MRSNGRSANDDVYLKKLGQKLAKLIQEKGYGSPYAFWIEKCDASISRGTLNHLLNGKVDPKITTLRNIARLLRVPLSELVELKDERFRQ